MEVRNQEETTRQQGKRPVSRQHARNNRAIKKHFIFNYKRKKVYLDQQKHVFN